MANQAFHEIFSTRMWDLHPEALQGYKNAILQNMAAHIPFTKKEDLSQLPYMLSSASAFRDAIYTGNTMDFDFDELGDDDRIINVVPIMGGILRSGGSRHHRDAIMRAADDKHTIGHLLYIDSPGGSSYAKYDYEAAINHVRAKGQPIIALVDGMACSAGYAAAAMCDEVYYVGAHDQVGCIGTMCAFLSNKDGDVNAITQERYVEVYATAAPNKNKPYRDAAQGDYDQLQQEVDALCTDFQQAMKASRPAITEEQLSGNTYSASEVEGTLVDGQHTFDECVQRIITLAGDKARPGMKRAGRSEASDTYKSSNNQNPDDMKEYPHMTAALKLEQPLQSDKENGVYLNEQQADLIEALANDKDALAGQLADKQAELERLNAEHTAAIEKLNAEHADTLAGNAEAHEADLQTLRTEHEAELNTLKTEHDDAMKNAAEAAQSQIDALNEQIASHTEALATRDADIADLRKQLADKEAELQELADSAGNEPSTGAAPTGNDNGADQEQNGVKTVLTEHMTQSEKLEAIRRREEELQQRMR